MTSLSRSIDQLSHSRYAASVLSGVLLGLSFPSYPFIRLELLAWVALVPLLLSLRTVEKRGELFRRVYLSMLLFCFISLWWVSLATLPGGVLTMLAQAFFLTVPLLAFYGVKKMAGYRFALFSLPFLWVAWEWAYMQQDLSLGWLTLGNSQANLNLMIQYADVTGVWGISFWLLWFNVLVVMALTSAKKELFRFVIPMALMILAPLLYSLALFSHDRGNTGTEAKLTVTLVQPNIDPHGKWVPQNSRDIMDRYYWMTDKAVRENRPDLVIWPETAIPFPVFDTNYADDLHSLRVSLRQWHTALLTGFVDLMFVGNQPYETYNASMLLEPGNKAPQIYRKMHLVPFAERVPYIDYFPWLGYATFSLSGISGWGRGRDASVMKLLTEKSRKAGMECFSGTERGTSSHCPACGHRHRPKGRNWACKKCDFRGHRDVVGSVNMHPLAYGEKIEFPSQITYRRAGITQGTKQPLRSARRSRPDSGLGACGPVLSRCATGPTTQIAGSPQGLGQAEGLRLEAHPL